MMTAAVVAILAASPASSGEPPAPVATAPIALDVRGCDDLPSAELRDGVAAELRHDVVLAFAVNGASHDPRALTVIVRCTPGRAEIVVEGSVAGAAKERVVRLDLTAPIARSRLVALAAAELIRAGRFGVEAGQRRIEQPVLDSPAPPLSAPAPLVGPNRVGFANRPYMAGVVSALGFRHTPVLWGGGLRLKGGGSTNWSWTTDAVFHSGLRRTALGAVSLESLSATASFCVDLERGVLSWSAAMGIRIGGARFRGVPNQSVVGAQGGLVRGPWGGPQLQIGLLLLPIRRLILTAALEAGWTLVPLTASVDRLDPVAIQSAWGTLSVGAGFLL
jgi:hypothetical protein